MGICDERNPNIVDDCHKPQLTNIASAKEEIQGRSSLTFPPPSSIVTHLICACGHRFGLRKTKLLVIVEKKGEGDVQCEETQANSAPPVRTKNDHQAPGSWTQSRTVRQLDLDMILARPYEREINRLGDVKHGLATRSRGRGTVEILLFDF